MLAKLRPSVCWQHILPAMLLPILLVSCGPSAGHSPGFAKATTAPTLTYVALGASDAFGIGTDDPDRESWPSQLANLLGPRVHLINLGIPGEIASQARLQELPIALASQPNIITVWLAVNDLADGITLTDYQVQFRALLISLRRGTRANIFVGNIPDLTLVPHFYGVDPLKLAAQVQQWNTAIASICNQVGATLVDIYSAWKTLASHPEYISSDGFHPSAVGARQLAQLFLATIRATPLPQTG